MCTYKIFLTYFIRNNIIQHNLSTTTVWADWRVQACQMWKWNWMKNTEKEAERKLSSGKFSWIIQINIFEGQCLTKER